MKRLSKIYAVIFAIIASVVMALPVSAAAEAGKAVSAVTLTTASKKVSISKCKITVKKTATYTGKAVKPKVTVKYGKKTLKSGKHYKLTYSANKKVGTAKIKITGIEKNGYTGSKTVSFKIVPAKPSLKVKSSTASSVTLSWKKAKGATKYVVYRYDSSKKKYTKLGTTSKLTYTAKKLTSGKKYTFAVKSYGKKNFLSDYSSKKSTYTLPAAVKNLTAQAGTNDAVLNWSKVTNATGYIVYKYDAETEKYTKLASTKKLTYTVSDLSEATDYEYAVAAYVSKTSYLGAKTNVKFTTLSAAPDKVENVAVTVKDGKAVLTWDKTAKAEGYTVYLYDNETGDYTDLENVKGTETFTYSVTDGLYSFAVAAYFTENGTPNYGDFSDVVSAGVPFKAVENVRAFSSTAPSVELVWDKKNGAEGYDIYTYNPETKEYTYLLDAGNEASAVISGVEAGKVYSYAVSAYFTADDKKIQGDYSDVVKANTDFGGTTTVKATAYNDTSITLKWDLIKGATSYNVYMEDTETGNYVLVDNTAFRNYTVKNCEAETVYKFAVTAVREIDENKYESIMTKSADVYYTKTAPSNLKKTYDIFRTGTFGVTYAIPYNDGEEILTETYLKNGNFLLIANMSVEGISLTAKTIYLSDEKEGYVIVPLGATGFYSKLSDAELSTDGMNTASLVEAMAPELNPEAPYTVETKEYNGQMCKCEGFVAKSGKVMAYYFNESGKLVGIEEVPQNDASSIMKVTDFTATVDDKKFNLPTLFPFGWTDIGSLA